MFVVLSCPNLQIKFSLLLSVKRFAPTLSGAIKTAKNIKIKRIFRDIFFIIKNNTKGEGIFQEYVLNK